MNLIGSNEFIVNEQEESRPGQENWQGIAYLDSRIDEIVEHIYRSQQALIDPLKIELENLINTKRRVLNIIEMNLCKGEKDD